LVDGVHESLRGPVQDERAVAPQDAADAAPAHPAHEHAAPYPRADSERAHRLHDRTGDVSGDEASSTRPQQAQDVLHDRYEDAAHRVERGNGSEPALSCEPEVQHVEDACRAEVERQVREQWPEVRLADHRRQLIAEDGDNYGGESRHYGDQHDPDEHDLYALAVV